MIDSAPAWLAVDLVIPFLGGKVQTTTPAARLAYVTGAAVVPVFVLWPETERCYIVRFQEQMAMSDGFAGDVQRLFATLEQVARECPEEYFWIFNRGWAGAK
jgi:lauroyl/myristoyl acyltransferase